MLKRLTFTLSLCLTVQFSIAGQSETGSGLLSGRPKIHISVSIKGPVKKLVSEDELKTDVELALRRNNIPVVSDKGDGVLFVAVNSVDLSLSSGSILAISANAGYVETAVQGRRLIGCLSSSPASDAFQLCITRASEFGMFWTNDDLWLVGSNNSSRIRADLTAHLLDDFYLKYLRANDGK